MAGQFLGEASPSYYPNKPILDAKLYLNSVNYNLSLTSAGIKLKKLSKGTSFRQKITQKLIGYKD